MNILCIDSSLAPAFEALGHCVRAARAPAGLVDVEELADGFKPDLLFQHETLGDRPLLRGLEDLDCPKAFWSLDSHLNIHWQKHYARLFDVVFTPHISLYEHMPKSWIPARLERLPMHGWECEFLPHAQRGLPMAFVGLDNPQTRPLRARFLKLLEPMGLKASAGLKTEEMLRLYGDARIVPNESIGFEVNFRLTEGASAGACVLSPAVGEDQDWLYVPDREIMVYEHGLDMMEKLHFFLRRPDLTEKLGRAAWESTRARHLAQHRATAVLDAMRSIAPGRKDALYLAMTLAQRGRAMRIAPPPSLLNSLARPECPEALALRLRCLSEYYPGKELEEAVHNCLTLPLRDGPDVPDIADALGREEVGFALLGHAVMHHDLRLFSLAWTLYHKNTPERPPSPSSLYHACLLLAEELRKSGRLFQPGLPYVPKAMTPESSLEALLMAELHAEGDKEWARRMDRLTERSKTLTLARLSALSKLLEIPQATLPGTAEPPARHAPKWRTNLDYGLTRLLAYDNAGGITELRRAVEEAAEQGRRDLAETILKKRGVDPVLMGL